MFELFQTYIKEGVLFVVECKDKEETADFMKFCIDTGVRKAKQYYFIRENGYHSDLRFQFGELKGYNPHKGYRSGFGVELFLAAEDIMHPASQEEKEIDASINELL